MIMHTKYYNDAFQFVSYTQNSLASFFFWKKVFFLGVRTNESISITCTYAMLSTMTVLIYFRVALINEKTNTTYKQIFSYIQALRRLM